MTPISYAYLQDKAFKLLIPIVSQNETQRNEALTMWGKEWDGRVIRLEHHSTDTTLNATADTNEQAPFYPEGLKVYIGEKGSLELQYEGIIFYEEELEPFLQSGI